MRASNFNRTAAIPGMGSMDTDAEHAGKNRPRAMEAYRLDDGSIGVRFPAQYLTHHPASVARQANAGGDVATVAALVAWLYEGESIAPLAMPVAPIVAASDLDAARTRAIKRGSDPDRAERSLIQRTATLWIGACRVQIVRNVKRFLEHVESVPLNKLPPKVAAKVKRKIETAQAIIAA